MKIDITLECPIVSSPRTVQISGMFDVAPSDKSRIEIRGDLPIETKPWNVGLIVGPSGAGKSSIARQLFGDVLVTGFDWPHDRSFIDAFPAVSIKEIAAALNAVGFGTIPNWFRNFHVLSNGEQFRATVARALLEAPDLLVIDEFTSVVDRQVAKIASHCIQKIVRRAQQQFIAVSCHYDIIEWLQPDWVYEPHLGAFEWRSLRRRPDLAVEVRSISKALWARFSRYHYLTSRLSPAAVCIGGFVDDQCVAFASAVRFVHPVARNIMQAHRTVVLPDYQGLGLGGRLSDWLGLYLWQHGWRFHATIAHPALIAYRLASPRWRLLRSGFQSGGGRRAAPSLKRHQERFSVRRISTSFEFTAPHGTASARRPLSLDELHVN